MRYTNSYIEEGIAKGRLEGIEEGRRESLAIVRKNLKLVLTTRFGQRADALVNRLSQLDLDALDKLQILLDARADFDELT